MPPAPLLSDSEVKRKLEGREGWEQVGNKVCKTFKWRDYKEAVEFVNRITPQAEDLYHHPDLEIHWNTVRVSLWSHDEGGLTVKDFHLAARIDAASGEH
jgi:4a-hydroxytetrahydrobiopterin dehydratase